MVCRGRHRRCQARTLAGYRCKNCVGKHTETMRCYAHSVYTEAYLADKLIGTKPLSDDQLHTVDAALARTDLELVTDKTDYPTYRSMARLRNTVWLDGEVISAYFDILEARSARAHAERFIPRRCRLKCWMADTYFFATLEKKQNTPKGFSNVVKKSTVHLPSLDRAMIPVHINGNHWCLAVVDFVAGQLQWYDPMGKKDKNGRLAILQSYLDYAYRNKYRQEVPKWVLVENAVSELKPTVPTQTNGYDCGVFVCAYAYFLSQNLSMDGLRQDHMATIRKVIAFDLLTRPAGGPKETAAAAYRPAY